MKETYRTLLANRYESGITIRPRGGRHAWGALDRPSRAGLRV